MRSLISVSVRFLKSLARVHEQWLSDALIGLKIGLRIWYIFDQNGSNNIYQIKENIKFFLKAPFNTNFLTKFKQL
jgi:hypothetical protein